MIAAAGSGTRLGAGGPKAFVELAGRPMIEWSLRAFAAAGSIGAIVIAAPPGEEERIEEICADATSSDAPGEPEVVAGGDHRSESVRNALERIDAELVAVHDAARPLVGAELINEIVAGLASRPEAAGVVAAAPVTDTVKRAREPRPAKGEAPDRSLTVAKTESRDHLWAAQTPQVFRAEALREALAGDPQSVAAATDDAMLVEKAGGKILIHPSPPENLKVTTAEDLRVAELFLTERRRGDA